MKPQDIVFIILFIFLFFKKDHIWSIWAGLSCFLLSIPLFYFWIFFTAERLTWYGEGFIFLTIFQIVITKDFVYNLLYRIRKLAASILRHQNIILMLMISIIFLNIASVVLQNKTKYFTFDYWQRYENLKYTYENSQYVQKNPKLGWIPDEFVNAYAGGSYLKGISPILIAPDTPPLGRYLIGLSALIFNNENIIILIASLSSLFLMYFLGMQIIKNQTISLLPPLFLSFEPIFKSQLIYVPLLDILQLPFLLSSFIIFNKAVNENNKKQVINFLLANISLGCFISIKFFITGFIVIASWGIIILLRRKHLLKFILTLPIAPVVLLLTYIKVLFTGYSFMHFLGVQKWVFLYHKSQLILPFSIWPLILFNKWYVWYGNKPIISDPQWRITWPIILILSLLTIVFYLFKKIKHNPNIEVLMLWLVFYLLFFSIGQITARYLVIFLPILYIVSIFGMSSFFENYSKKIAMIKSKCYNK